MSRIAKTPTAIQAAVLAALEKEGYGGLTGEEIDQAVADRTGEEITTRKRGAVCRTLADNKWVIRRADGTWRITSMGTYSLARLREMMTGMGRGFESRTIPEILEMVT